ncbi:GNAT family N-acetyltransferase [Novipirellula artificiosorum]|uniref:N-acyltransferase YncA n=1 Tax=Novipirellula artificiosorum TaxID=2528016 RepID=A0A5C6DH64_9BACT|nr:GNAT family N-acetyltransferase [Novipirellula artificiosorum]TWU35988.1 N-acyltransferase YncA [Novipirellula artificiosorum]
MQSSESNVAIRKATSRDAEQVAAIYNHYVDLGGATFDGAHQTVSAISTRINASAPDGWYVAETNDKIVGWACARRYSERYGYRFSCETAIYMIAEVAGRGIADQLQQRIHRHCVTCNLHHAVARIIANNQRSLAFHYRHGYELVGTQRAIGRMEDRWVDVVILQKVFG